MGTMPHLTGTWSETAVIPAHEEALRQVKQALQTVRDAEQTIKAMPHRKYRGWADEARRLDHAPVSFQIGAFPQIVIMSIGSLVVDPIGRALHNRRSARLQAKINEEGAVNLVPETYVSALKDAVEKAAKLGVPYGEAMPGSGRMEKTGRALKEKDGFGNSSACMLVVKAERMLGLQ